MVQTHVESLFFLLFLNWLSCLCSVTFVRKQNGNIFRKILKREYPNEVKIVSLFTLISCLLAQLKKQKLFETYRRTCKSFQSEVTTYTKKNLSVSAGLNYGPFACKAKILPFGHKRNISGSREESLCLEKFVKWSKK